MRQTDRRIQNGPNRLSAQLVNLTKRLAQRINANPSVRLLKKNLKKDYPVSKSITISKMSMDLTEANTAFAGLLIEGWKRQNCPEL